ncbi:hypothetical protein JOD45_000151 [Scopulibacillus daqui]|uniref:PPM-type phosphatase domain-containing protein n=1 Tax=Scopulibacillus daqui TaxID=1469162 RepID=A0ABS2PW70_9BACL|nr:protein phosphatase 2C domain-containing protein [Scopulibacillus daqui]MBM7643960.1 hypothetical protein [Scopulibacillus daqui]
MFSFLCDQRSETPINRLYEDPFFCLYGYARSNETQQHNDVGQDYLIFKIDDRSCAFVLCDGVSLSFCGDIAARFLSHKLMDWLKVFHLKDLQDKDVMKERLEAYLHDIVDEATELVDKKTLPPSMPVLLKDVLEEKRKQGSEAMFVCGRVDMLSPVANEANVFLAWAGDSRIRLWDQEEEITNLLGHDLNSNQRWSTKRGLVNGGLQTFVSSDVDNCIDHLAVYSDGFQVIDQFKTIPSAEFLPYYMSKSLDSPASDDISFLELLW